MGFRTGVQFPSPPPTIKPLYSGKFSVYSGFLCKYSVILLKIDIKPLYFYVVVMQYGIWNIATVADGVGMCKHSHKSSNIAVKSFCFHQR